MKLSGKERDDESGLDDFGARYYSSAYGRFMSADPPFIDQNPGDPQSWNLFAYVRNNPLKFVDPSGNAPQASQPMLMAETTPQDTDPFRSVYGDDDENAVWTATAGGEYLGTFASEDAARAAAHDETAEQPQSSGTQTGQGPAEGDRGHALMDNREVQTASYKLFEKAGFGNFDTERSMWVISKDDQYSFVPWPFSAETAKETWRGPPPDGAVAVVHTHPSKKSHWPSGPDHDLADGKQSKSIKMPVVCSPRGWHIDGCSGCAETNSSA